MIKVIFTLPEGQTRAVDAKSGSTLMEAARDNGVQGIVAEMRRRVLLRQLSHPRR